MGDHDVLLWNAGAGSRTSQGDWLAGWVACCSCRGLSADGLPTEDAAGELADLHLDLHARPDTTTED